MFTLPMLPPQRQRNVGTALEEHFKSKPKYTAEVTAGAKAVILATPALTRDELSMFTIDVATDGVLSAIFRIVQGYQRGFVSTVVSLGAEQQAQYDAAALIEQTWFSSGIGFIRDAVGIQHAAMTSMRKSLDDPDEGPALRAAIETVGLSALVDHFLLHADIYGKKLGLTGDVVTGADGDPSDVWHDLYVKFAIDVSSAYKNDPATRKTLLGSYESQLAEHHATLAKDRKKAKAAAEMKAKADAENVAKKGEP